jgi:signal transduction histidine kinase
MRLSNFIRVNRRSIITEWESFARSLLSPPMGDLLLRDHIEEILTAIASDMLEHQTPADQEKKGKGDKRVSGGALDAVARHHAQQRIEVGLNIAQAASELRALRASIVRLWEKARPVPDEHVIDELIRFNETVDQILVGSVKASVERVSRYRDQFLAILGHDLRTPLGAIAMAAEVINRAENIDLRCGRGPQAGLRPAL